MKIAQKIFGILIVTILLWSTLSIAQSNGATIDKSKHEGLVELSQEAFFKVLHSKGHETNAREKAILISDAYQFLSEIMGPKKEFCLLVVAMEDWSKNAYMPIPGLPEYYKGNIIVGAGENAMADDYEQMLDGFLAEITTKLYEIYKDENGDLDMKLFFDKLAIHELTHNFQDPSNESGYSVSRWLEEIHANMGLYAYYKTRRPKELKYVMTLVDFSINNPPPNTQFTSLEDFDTNYYSMSPGDYGMYQMKFTKVAEKVIDTVGNEVLKNLNDFISKYDEPFKDIMTLADIKLKLGEEVHPIFVEIINNWN